MDDESDPVHDASAKDFPREASGLHGTARQPGESGHGVVRVDGGKGSAVARVERLEQVGRLGAAHLADDDVIGPMPERVLDEIPDGDAPLAQLSRASKRTQFW